MAAKPKRQMDRLPNVPKHRRVTARLLGEEIIESPDGSFREWWRNGELHREDGPAVELADGYKAWWRNGQRHREGGPAVEWADGGKEWWRDGRPHAQSWTAGY